ncbi:MAG: hypothetical protein IT379_14650 [Deltaproteobacteria bacterium]|nr:hypothetical protein [Deltaproteobacteria bacterium]
MHGRQLEPVDELALPDGSEVTLTIEIPQPREERKRVEFAVWDLGVKVPIARDVIYDGIG